MKSFDAKQFHPIVYLYDEGNLSSTYHNEIKSLSYFSTDNYIFYISNIQKDLPYSLCLIHEFVTEKKIELKKLFFFFIRK